MNFFEFVCVNANLQPKFSLNLRGFVIYLRITLVAIKKRKTLKILCELFLAPLFFKLRRLTYNWYKYALIMFIYMVVFFTSRSH